MWSNDPKYKEWLNSLQIGNEVAIPDTGWYRRPPAICRVEGFTKTCIRVGGQLYYKENGSCRGGRGSIQPFTAEVKHERRMYEIDRYFDHEFQKTGYPALTDTQKIALINLIKEMLKESREGEEDVKEESTEATGESSKAEN